MLNTTFRLLRKFHACKEGYKEFRKYKSPWGDNQPISLQEILEVRGLDDALWSLRATVEPAERETRRLACDYAEHAKKNIPPSENPRTGHWEGEEIQTSARRIAETVAGCHPDVISARFASSEWAAAWEAAFQAEKAWQKGKFLEMLGE